MGFTTLDQLLFSIGFCVLVVVLVFRVTRADKGQKNDNASTVFRGFILLVGVVGIFISLISYFATKKNSPVCQERGGHDFSQVIAVNDALTEEYPLYSFNRAKVYDGYEFDNPDNIFDWVPDGHSVYVDGYNVCYIKDDRSVQEELKDSQIKIHYVTENPRIEFHKEYYNSQLCKECGEHKYDSVVTYYVLYILEEANK